MKKKIIMLASGNGSNVENICRYFQKSKDIEVSGVFTNNPNAYLIKRLIPFEIEVEVFGRIAFINGELLEKIKSKQPDLIVLAGFLWKIGLDWLELFPNNIINIHPALLPMYGGKGMYGHRVHQEVKKNHEKETGITIHYVNEAYDKGQIIFQAKVNLNEKDTPDIIASKVKNLEYANFPKVIQSLLFNSSN
tara:strand:+ start:5928 stop:6503 length:576 start_codon:yes stop_codon:yes gene_type:complete